MRPGCQRYWTDAVVRREGQPVGFRQGGNPAALGNAAAPTEVEHHHIDSTGVEEALVSVDTGQSFAKCQGHVSCVAQSGEGIVTVELDRVFDPVRGVIQQGLADLDRGRGFPQTVQLDHDLYTVTRGGPDLFERLEAGFQFLGGEILSSICSSDIVERPDFHGCDALVQEVQGQFVSVVKEGVQVLVRATWRQLRSSVRAGGPARAPIARLCLPVVIAAARVVNPGAITYPAPQQLVEGLVANLAEQVPKRNIDGRVRAASRRLYPRG